MISDRMDINRVLAEMRSLKAQTQVFNEIDKPGDKFDLQQRGSLKAPEEVSSFGDVFNQALGKVRELEQASSAAKTAFEQGRPGVDITDVMIASQKSSVAFQATLQVRNRVIEAYRDIMNMPV